MAKIYVVEDNESLRELYILHLTQKGHEVIGQASDGNEALVDLYFNFKLNPPDILIIDYKMPGKNGIELLKDLRKLNCSSKSKIFFITGMNNKESEIRELGVTRYIQKPIKFSLLNEEICKVLAC